MVHPDPDRYRHRIFGDEWQLELRLMLVLPALPRCHRRAERNNRGSEKSRLENCSAAEQTLVHVESSSRFR